MNKCPDCNGELEAGALLDSTYGAVLAQRYAKSDPLYSKKKKFMWMHEMTFKDIRRVITYRCTKCSRLFSYAEDIISVENLNARTQKIVLSIFFIVVIWMIVFIAILSALGV